MKRVAIITSSDTGYRGEREDLSGPAIKEIVEREGYEVVSMDILPDDQVMLAGKMQAVVPMMESSSSAACAAAMRSTCSPVMAKITP